LIVVFHFVLNITWHKLNTAPPTWDSAGHLVIGYIFADNIKGFLSGHVSLLNLIKISPYYPPFIQFLGGLSYLILGRNYEITILLGTVFLAIACVYLYKIVKVYFDDEKLAVLTVFIFSFFPGVWEQSRQFHLDVPLVALLLASYYHLISSDSLKNKKHSLLFFLYFSLAQLTKWYGFVYLVVPFVIEVVVKSIKALDFKDQKGFLIS